MELGVRLVQNIHPWMAHLFARDGLYWSESQLFNSQGKGRHDKWLESQHRKWKQTGAELAQSHTVEQGCEDIGQSTVESILVTPKSYHILRMIILDSWKEASSGPSFQLSSSILYSWVLNPSVALLSLFRLRAHLLAFLEKPFCRAHLMLSWHWALRWTA